MTAGRGSSVALRALTGAVALALAPGVASAHGVPTERFEAPLPLEFLLGGAAATVALTALWLAVAGEAWPGPRRERVVGTVSARTTRIARPVAGVGFLALFAVAIADGVLGRQVVGENLATVFTWPVWFRGLALVAILVGTPWRTLSPWRTLYRGLVRVEGGPVAVLGSPPTWLGAWPALVGFVVLIGVVEPLTVIPRSPRLTVGVVATYGLAMFGGAVLYGEAWFHAADPLAVFYRVLGRASPVVVEPTPGGEGVDDRVRLRVPWQGCLPSAGGLSLAAFVVAALYTVSFDGFSNTLAYQDVLFSVRDLLGTGPTTSVLLYLLGLIAFLVAFALVSVASDALGGGSVRGWAEAVRRFAPTFVPIAAGYELAHNYPYVLRNAGALVELLLEPILAGVGPIEPLAWLSVSLFWWSQVLLIVGGHVVGVVAAHYVATTHFDSPRSARLGHLPLVVLMVGYTVLSLWIVSRPVVA